MLQQLSLPFEYIDEARNRAPELVPCSCGRNPAMETLPLGRRIAATVFIDGRVERWAHDKVWRVVCRCGRFSLPKAERQMAVDDWNH
ncbi:MAG: hypothetical protein ACQES2_00580 [Pseudomonadota bacterium]